MNRFKYILIAPLLCACSSNVVIEQELKGNLNREVAQQIRQAIIADERYSKLYKIEDRKFYFGACDNPEMDSNQQPLNCDYSIWLGLTKVYGCVENVYVTVDSKEFNILGGITLCR